jgi:hypothetical protein
MTPANPTAEAWLAFDAAACDAIERGVPADLVGVCCLQIGAAILVAALGTPRLFQKRVPRNGSGALSDLRRWRPPGLCERVPVAGYEERTDFLIVIGRFGRIASAS